jgi:hypothetical protein
MRTLQIRDRQFGVVLERIKRLVTQQLLDVIHVRTGAQQLGRAAAPERMRGYRDIQPGRFRVGMYKPPQCVIGQPITRPIQKDPPPETSSGYKHLDIGFECPDKPYRDSQLAVGY